MQLYLDFVLAHPLLFAALAGVVLLIIANEVHGNLTGGKRLSIPEAVRLINDREPLIVDVRAVADFKRSHLLNALNIPLAKIDERVTELGRDKARPILIYDALGSSVGEAADKLKKLGYAEAYPLRGGINSWLGASLPVTAK
ncbi:MAG: rhodanese-like protein [Hydrocarboniphaga sp.]|uniref:rhodanese-like domain-containing protein n=1 Tax=Hydrocarboniphaga sp. TaxID=2033016 RepID=UPI00261DB442|nr:rhodanese-like domain-containing protein [Hydrocarboniphaga sp.]MDB5972053.1 rhodanese-like protein [Hydrocarboniphaga sp.]